VHSPVRYFSNRCPNAYIGVLVEAASKRLVGVGRAKVERARTVLSDEQAKEEVLSGEKSINRASEEVQERKKAEREILGIRKPKAKITQDIEDTTQGSCWPWQKHRKGTS
jgi:hypothetical protein